MTMKYRQRGYRDSDRPTERRPEPMPQLSPEERVQQRSLRHAVSREANEVGFGLSQALKVITGILWLI